MFCFSTKLNVKIYTAGTFWKMKTIVLASIAFFQLGKDVKFLRSSRLKQNNYWRSFTQNKYFWLLNIREFALRIRYEWMFFHCFSLLSFWMVSDNRHRMSNQEKHALHAGIGENCKITSGEKKTLIITSSILWTSQQFLWSNYGTIL